MKKQIHKLVCDIIDKTVVDISESDCLDILEIAEKTAMNHIAARLDEIPMPGLPYLKVKLDVWGDLSNYARSALVAFISKSDTNYLKLHIAAWFNRRVIYTNTKLCHATDENIDNAIRDEIISMRSKAVLEDNPEYEDYFQTTKNEKTLELKADLVTPVNLLDVLIEQGASDAVNIIREREYATLCDMCSSQFDLVHVVVDAGRACDGVMAEFAGKITRIANELPMIKQEAKSYTIDVVKELLAPYRLEDNRQKMISFGSW